MATDLHKQEFRIRDLTTRSVLLFPTRAQIIRDVKNIALQPGGNQIIIDGLAPTVDEHSIKVEGTGSATITEVSVDLLPNREVYEDIYPSDSEDEDDSDEEEEAEEIEAMTAINTKIRDLHVTLLKEQEIVNSASNRLQICDNFGKSVEKARPQNEDLEGLLSAYRDERAKIYEDHETATAAAERINKEITKAEKEKTKIAKALVKANEKKMKEKAKLREKKLRKDAENAKERQRIRFERESFWPKKVYRVTINVEPTTINTPQSSRRNSIDSDTVVNLATSDFHEPNKVPLKDGEISLSLSYITYDASWTPRYDLSLNTVKCTGSLDYGAELKNTTSETWRDAKVVLSTSQTTFSGLSETIPILHPWHVRLQKGGNNHNSALFSTKELQSKQSEYRKEISGQYAKKPRHEVYGVEFGGWKPNMAQNRNQQVQQIIQNHQPGLFASTSAFGANSNTAPSNGFAPQVGGLFGSAPAAPAPPVTERHRRAQFLDVEAEAEEYEAEADGDEIGYGRFDEGPVAAKPLLFEEGAWEESGMTTTYDVPGTKTLAPSNSSIKHKIAKVEFRNIVFSHMVIGKLRQVAFLKAKMRNSSKISLLKGPLGLTLDGSFLGQATFPRCSAGESFSLPLGVDPAINISYPKPTVRRSQSGIFTKEDSNSFTRTITIMNTKHNAAVDLTVIDQVPVSEDERLKIEIINPRGLKPGSDGVRAGQSAFTVSASSASGGTAKDVRASVYGSDGKDGNGKWGSAVATTKKGGEVLWNVKLNPGQGVKLTLEYEATFPGGESVVGVDERRGQGNSLFD